MARLCVELRMTPEEFWRLTVEEHNALVKELQDRAKEQAKAMANRR